MKNILLLLVLYSGVFSVSFAEEERVILALSSWDNQAGSTLHIESINDKGLMKGTYTNRAKGYGCQNIPYPMTGWLNGTAITFTVKWQHPQESCGSLTAWTGFIKEGQIITMWQIVNDATEAKESVFKGEAIFNKNQ